MKNFITFVNIGIVFFLGWILSEKNDTTDAKQLADNSNIELAEAKMPVLTASFATTASKSDASVKNVAKVRNEETTEFIMEISEARIMDMEEGKLAEQRATSRQLKDYGTLMVTDQSSMLRDLKAIARDKHITISKALEKIKQKVLPN